MGSRRLARERALQALYQLDGQTGSSPNEALEAAFSSGVDADDKPRDQDAYAFAMRLVEGVLEHMTAIDQLIEQHSHHWRVDRMSKIDRNVLRLGSYELKFADDIPAKVTINEAVELGKRFGSEESSSFVNGLLDKVAHSLGKS